VVSPNEYQENIGTFILRSRHWFRDLLFLSSKKIPAGVSIDKIIVVKSKHRLFAYSNGQLVVTYKVAIGKDPTGRKEFEGDMKTPEGSYTIIDKNARSEFYKNLGISYPNQQDIIQAERIGKAAGGDIKIHV